MKKLILNQLDRIEYTVIHTSFMMWAGVGLIVSLIVFLFGMFLSNTALFLAVGMKLELANQVMDISKVVNMFSFINVLLWICWAIYHKIKLNKKFRKRALK